MPFRGCVRHCPKFSEKSWFRPRFVAPGRHDGFRRFPSPGCPFGTHSTQEPGTTRVREKDSFGRLPPTGFAEVFPELRMPSGQMDRRLHSGSGSKPAGLEISGKHRDDRIYGRETLQEPQHPGLEISTSTLPVRDSRHRLRFFALPQLPFIQRGVVGAGFTNVQFGTPRLFRPDHESDDTTRSYQGRPRDARSRVCSQHQSFRAVQIVEPLGNRTWDKNLRKRL